MKLKIYISMLVFLIYISMMGQESKPSTLSNVTCQNILHVHKFEFKKNWKVVAGEDLDYQAKPDNGDTFWDWKLGSGPCDNFNSFWTLQSLNGSFAAKKNNGVKITNMPPSNSDFGYTHGLVKVNNSTETSCKKSDGSDAKVKVFFRKDDTNNPNGTVPNWFYYWSQALPTDIYSLPVFNINSPANPLFENIKINFIYSNTGSFAWTPGTGSSYGRAHVRASPLIPLDFNNPNSPRYANGYEIDIIFGEGTSMICGHELQENLSTGEITVVSGTGSTGISCFYQVYVHEMYHIEIFKDNYRFGYIEGQDSDFDGYSDDFELRHYDDGFRIGIKDDYKNGKGSIGYEYEEKLCRAKEDAADPKTLSNLDWSFDENHNIKIGRTQGKNW